MRSALLCLLALLYCAALPGQEGEPYAQAIEQHRREYCQKLLLSPRPPLDSAGVGHLRFFPPDERYRLEGAFTRTPDAEPFDMPTYSGITKAYVKYGEVSFALGGETYTLAVYQNLQSRQMPLYRDLLFLPFKDATNGEGSYGGGRYMDFRIGAIREGRIALDFNMAYNPYCAYSDGFNCPIPPLENHLLVPIQAGEMDFLWHDE